MAGDGIASSRPSSLEYDFFTAQERRINATERNGARTADVYGYVEMGLPSTFSVSHASETTVTWGRTISDEWKMISGATVTIQASGLYLVGWTLRMTGSASGSYRTVGVKRNGGYLFFDENPAGGTVTSSACRQCYLLEGNTVSLFVSQDSGTSITAGGASDWQAWFGVHYVGARRN